MACQLCRSYHTGNCVHENNWYTQQVQLPRGWECPKCGCVYAPGYPSCDKCGKEDRAK